MRWCPRKGHLVSRPSWAQLCSLFQIMFSTFFLGMRKMVKSFTMKIILSWNKIMTVAAKWDFGIDLYQEFVKNIFWGCPWRLHKFTFILKFSQLLLNERKHWGFVLMSSFFGRVLSDPKSQIRLGKGLLCWNTNCGNHQILHNATWIATAGKVSKVFPSFEIHFI